MNAHPRILITGAAGAVGHGKEGGKDDTGLVASGRGDFMNRL